MNKWLFGGVFLILSLVGFMVWKNQQNKIQVQQAAEQYAEQQLIQQRENIARHTVRELKAVGKHSLLMVLFGRHDYQEQYSPEQVVMQLDSRTRNYCKTHQTLIVMILRKRQDNMNKATIIQEYETLLSNINREHHWEWGFLPPEYRKVMNRVDLILRKNFVEDAYTYPILPKADYPFFGYDQTDQKLEDCEKYLYQAIIN